MPLEQFTSRRLDQKGWAALAQELGRVGGGGPPTGAILDYLRRRANAVYVVTERNYVDRDHRSSASHFYSHQFRATPRLCSRYHFFTADNGWLARPGEAPPARYVGYIVRRPVADAPIGRSVLVVNGAVPRARVPCAACYKPHVNETGLEVLGVPYCEQDGAVMSCAETSIWVATRALRKRYDHPLIVASQIATADTVGVLSAGRLLPSGGLTTEQIANVLTTFGFGTLYYDREKRTSARDSEWQDPIPLCAPYLASGIPVILPGMGHAVTACGALMTDNRKRIPRAALLPAHAWLDALVVQDDARGPYRLMPKDDDSYWELCAAGFRDLLVHGALSKKAIAKRLTSPDWWMTADHVEAALVPLPRKIFFTARDVEVLAREYLTGKGFENEVRTRLQLAARGNDPAREFLHAVDRGRGIVYSIRCRKSVDVRTDIGDPSKNDHPIRHLLRHTPLPRLVWVVEYTTYDRFIRPRQDERLVLGEFYIDATADPCAGPPALLFAHYPGMTIFRPFLSSPEGRVDVESRMLFDDRPVLRANIPFWSDGD